jgi:hypothetical protein
MQRGEIPAESLGKSLSSKLRTMFCGVMENSCKECPRTSRHESGG